MRQELKRVGSDPFGLKSWQRAVLSGAIGAPAVLVGSAAQAQLNPSLIRTVILPDFNRDRNQGVTERARPDFDAIGVQVGSFLISPQLSVATGATSNVLLTDANRRSDIYTVYEPALRVASNWSVHRIALDAVGDIRRYASTSARNQDAGYVNAQGRLDVSRQITVLGEAQISRVFESPFSDDLAVNQTYFSHFTRSSASMRGIYTSGRLRATAILDHSDYSFAPIRFIDSRTGSQSFRDRTIDRGTAIAEYGVTPTVAFYAQAVYDRTRYPNLLAGNLANRDSNGTTVIGGVSFDIAGLMRGAAGIGYTSRDYLAAGFNDASGISLQSRLDFFPTELTTVGVSLQRQIQDANLGNGSAFVDNRIGLNVDHELLRNLILSANANRIRRSYFENDAQTNVTQAGASARFQMTRSLSFDLNTSYGAVAPVGGLRLGVKSTEWRGQISVRIRR